MSDALQWSCDRLNPEKMKVLALLLADPNPIHFDVEATRRLGLGDRQVNQGPSNIAMVVNMLHECLPDARLIQLRTKLLGTAFAGDAIDAGGEIIERRTEAQVERITCRVWLGVRGGGRIIEGDAVLETRRKE